MTNHLHSWSAQALVLILLIAALPISGCKSAHLDRLQTGPLVAIPNPAPDKTETAALSLETLAVLELPDRTVRFAAIPFTGELLYIERHQGEPTFGSDSELTVLERYLELTSADTAIPRLLLEFDEAADRLASHVAQRTSTDRVIGPRVAAEFLPPDVLQAPQHGPPPACRAPSGRDYFRDNHCYYAANELILRNRRDPQWGCADGRWNYLRHTAENARRKSLSTTAACGSDARVEHQYWAFGRWHKPVSERIPNGHVVTVFRTGGWWLLRRINHYREGGGFVRGYSEFSN